MSENLDLVRSIFQAWGRGDVERFLREHFEPTARLDLSANIFNPAVYEGYEGIARQRREVNDVWESFEVEVERLFEGEDAVVAFTHEHGRGEASGVEVDRHSAFLFRLRDGKVSEVRSYLDRDRALADLGLKEQAMSQENVELLRRGIEAWNRRELDVWLDLGTPDVEWMPAGPAAVERTVYRGYDEVREGIEAVFETWEVFEFQEGEVRDLGEATVWLGRVRMRGNASGVELDQEFAIHGVARDGRMALIHSFLSWHEALKAVGLEEQARSENLDLVRSIYADWERGDLSSAEWAHPEIEYMLVDGPAPFSRSGLSGLAEGWREFLSAWEDFRVENVEYRQLDSERVLMLDLLSGRDTTSGVELGQMQAKGASLFHVRGGKVTRIVTYWDRDHALADLGLAEQAMSQENVEALRSFWETWNTSEAPDMSLLDPDVTYEDTVLPDHIGETYRGPEGVARAVARWFEPFAKITISLERIVGDGDRLVSVHRWRAKAKHTGIEFENPIAYAWTWRHGKVVHFKSFWDPDEALKAVGLEE